MHKKFIQTSLIALLISSTCNDVCKSEDVVVAFDQHFLTTTFPRMAHVDPIFNVGVTPKLEFHRADQPLAKPTVEYGTIVSNVGGATLSITGVSIEGSSTNVPPNTSLRQLGIKEGDVIKSTLSMYAGAIGGSYDCVISDVRVKEEDLDKAMDRWIRYHVMFVGTEINKQNVCTNPLNPN
jgi:hypothetical protein